jgi:hypothetical protein
MNFSHMKKANFATILSLIYIQIQTVKQNNTLAFDKFCSKKLKNPKWGNCVP